MHEVNCTTINSAISSREVSRIDSRLITNYPGHVLRCVLDINQKSVTSTYLKLFLISFQIVAVKANDK